MSSTFNKVKNLFNSSASNTHSSSTELTPEIGFKITYFEQTRQLIVKVIGARHLPTIYGSIKPHGYLVKVRVHPGRDKYETDIVKESWPNFNQEIPFDLQPTLETIKQQFQGKFVTLTAYAVLECQNNNNQPKRTNSLRNSFKFFVGKEEDVEIRTESRNKYSSNRFTFNNRRTVGAVTYNLDPKKFSQKNQRIFATPDIWRPLQNITSGIDFEKKDPKCTLEVTLTYYNSEDGNNDRLEVSLSKLRCSMKSMQKHEKYGGSLYLKITAFEYDVRTSSWKSDRFEPTISMKIVSASATLQAVFQRYNLQNVQIFIRMLCKNMLAKKTLLGKIEINYDSDIFKQAVKSPSVPVTQTLNLE